MTIPEDCPSKYSRLMKKCWANDINDRPEFTTILHKLDDMFIPLIQAKQYHFSFLNAPFIFIFIIYFFILPSFNPMLYHTFYLAPRSNSRVLKVRQSLLLSHLPVSFRQKEVLQNLRPKIFQTEILVVPATQTLRVQRVPKTIPNRPTKRIVDRVLRGLTTRGHGT